MKKLSELYEVSIDVLIKGIAVDSKKCKTGDLFVCAFDQDIDTAIKNGAVAVVTDRMDIAFTIPMVYIPNLVAELPYLCAKFFDYPHKKMKMIGVSECDNTAHIASIVQTLIGSERCGLIGKKCFGCASFSKDAAVFDDVFLFYSSLDDLVKSGCSYTVLEETNQNFSSFVFQPISFDVGIFPSPSDSSNVLLSKIQKEGVCVMGEAKSSYSGRSLAFGKNENCDLRILEVNLFSDKTQITFCYQKQEYIIHSPLLGYENVFHLSAAILSCLALGFSFEDAFKNVSKLRIRGQFEFLRTHHSYYVMVDDSHTDSMIRNVFQFLSRLDINRILVVIGAPGECDVSLRPLIGKVVLDNADYVFFTSQDSRGEDPEEIIFQMLGPEKDTYINYEVILDRREAIDKAIFLAREKDLVLILGKGVDTYQETEKGRIYFNDIEEAYHAVLKKEDAS